jgi:hypothetical protein
MMGGQSAYVLPEPTLPMLIRVQGNYANASGVGIVRKATTVRTPTRKKVS